MPDPKRSASIPSFPRSAPRIVLFGMPGAGKSSLLGALAQAGQTQERLLDGHLTDGSHALDEMQRRLYEDSPCETVEEVLPFLVSFVPLTASNQVQPKAVEAVIIDCDGRVANDLLARRRPLESGRNSLGNTVLEADTLLMLIDASVGPAQIEANFAEFKRFLTHLEIGRGQRTDVGGLPVFLVLTKCDLLAQPQDDLGAWMERIEDRKRRLGQRFEDYLARNKTSGVLPFGSVCLHLWATSGKRPALVGDPPRPREPYGVAELFRLAFQEARSFRSRRGRSSWRLLVAVVGAFAAVSILAALSALLFLTRPNLVANPLEIEVDRFKTHEQEQSPQTRHRQAKLSIDELLRFSLDPAYAALPPEKKDFVERRLKDLHAYRDFEKRLEDIPDPRDVRNTVQLQALKIRLQSLSIPDEYRGEWNRTEMGQRWVGLKEDVAAIEATLTVLEEAYGKSIRDGKQVLAEAAKDRLPTRAKRVLEQAKELPNPTTERNKPIPGSERVTYATVFGFADLKEILRVWEEEIKGKLEFAASLKMS